MTGYDQKSLKLSHDADTPVVFRMEVDITGTGTWIVYKELSVNPGQTLQYDFPDAFSAYWVRLVADRDCSATALFHYE
jgi:hypothetical protein